MGKDVARPGLRKRQMSEADVTEFHEKKIFKIDDHIKLQNMNRVPVIQITQSSATPSLPVTTFQRILPSPPVTLIPVSRLQSIKKIDSSNNIENVVIKTEPVEETDNPSPSEGDGLSVSSTGSVLMTTFSMLLLESIFLILWRRLTGIKVTDGPGRIFLKVVTGREGGVEDCVIFITGTLFMFCRLTRSSILKIFFSWNSETSASDICLFLRPGLATSFMGTSLAREPL